MEQSQVESGLGVYGVSIWLCLPKLDLRSAHRRNVEEDGALQAYSAMSAAVADGAYHVLVQLDPLLADVQLLRCDGLSQGDGLLEGALAQRWSKVLADGVSEGAVDGAEVDGDAVAEQVVEVRGTRVEEVRMVDLHRAHHLQGGGLGDDHVGVELIALVPQEAAHSLAVASPTGRCVLGRLAHDPVPPRQEDGVVVDGHDLSSNLDLDTLCMLIQPVLLVKRLDQRLRLGLQALVCAMLHVAVAERVDGVKPVLHAVLLDDEAADVGWPHVTDWTRRSRCCIRVSQPSEDLVVDVVEVVELRAQQDEVAVSVAEPDAHSLLVASHSVVGLEHSCVVRLEAGLGQSIPLPRLHAVHSQMGEQDADEGGAERLASTVGAQQDVRARGDGHLEHRRIWVCRVDHDQVGHDDRLHLVHLGMNSVGRLVVVVLAAEQCLAGVWREGHSSIHRQVAFGIGPAHE